MLIKHDKLGDTWEKIYKHIGLVKNIIFIKKIFYFFFIKLVKNSEKWIKNCINLEKRRGLLESNYEWESLIFFLKMGKNKFLNDINSITFPLRSAHWKQCVEKWDLHPELHFQNGQQ